MTKALIFDLGNVLVPFDFARGYAELQSHCSLDPSEIRKRIGERRLAERYESGEIDSATFHHEMEHVLGVGIAYAEFCRIWNSVFYPVTLFADEMLATLAARYPLILLSNTNPIHFSMLRERYPIFRHFHELVLSYEVGAMKPAAAIYEEALRRARCRPEECFYTDDIAEYVAAARRHGIDAVQFRSAAQIEEELKARGVRWDGSG